MHALLLLLASVAWAAPAGGHAAYLGGTVPKLEQGAEGALDAVDQQYLVFWTRKSNLRVPYEKINLLEYGQNVNRHVALAVLISPMFLLSKKRQHFLTVGYQDEEGRQQAMVFKVEKSGIRTVLAMLEARTGLRVQYQDDEARRGSKG